MKIFNILLIIAGVFIFLVGLFELSQGDSSWWTQSLKGIGFVLAGIALNREKKAE